MTRLSDVVRGVKDKINIVAWLKYVDHGGACPTEIIVCNPDDEGAFPVHHSLASAEVVVDEGTMHQVYYEATGQEISLEIAKGLRAIATAIESGSIISLKGTR